MNAPAFTYSIYDANPAQSGACAWPDHDGEPIPAHADNDDLNTAIAVVKQIAETQGRACGEYEDGTTIWYTIWDEDYTIAHSGTVTI